jgi:flavodoxin I
MKKTVIIYGSTTGNTETLAQEIAKLLVEHDVSLIPVSDATHEHILSSDLILLGSSTWGYGELQDDFIPFYDAMNSTSFSGKNVAVFGCGDSISFSDVFCQAVSIIEEKVQALGGILITDGLRVDGGVADNLDAVHDFVKSLI